MLLCGRSFVMMNGLGMEWRRYLIGSGGGMKTKSKEIEMECCVVIDRRHEDGERESFVFID